MDDVSSRETVLLGIFTLSGTIITAVLAFLVAWMQIKSKNREGRRDVAINEINDAVNNRHERGGKKLYDLVLENHSKTHQLEQWNQTQDRKIDQLATKMDSLPCYTIAERICPDELKD